MLLPTSCGPGPPVTLTQTPIQMPTPPPPPSPSPSPALPTRQGERLAWSRAAMKLSGDCFMDDGLGHNQVLQIEQRQLKQNHQEAGYVNGNEIGKSMRQCDSKCNNNNNNNNTIITTTTTSTTSITSTTTTSTTTTTTKNNNGSFKSCSKSTATTTTAEEAIATATATKAAARGTILPTAAAKWLLMFVMLFSILAQSPHQVAAEKSKHYIMQSLCKNHFLQQLYRKIDGAVLWSQNERNLDCIITFQTHSILQRFMLRFDMLQLDCNDHLYVYDGAHAVATPKIDITCRNTKQTVSSLLTHTNFVTLKYVTDGWGTDANGFKLVITSVNDHKHTCKDFTCTSREFCISPDLLCDGINHCGDNSDESVHNLCQNDDSSTIFGIEMTWFVLIVVSVLLTLSAVVAGISICVCRRQEDAALNQNTAVQLHTAETNGSSKHLHFYHGGTLSRDHTTTLPGNWHHPAGPSGYYRTPHNLSKMMATKVRPIWCLDCFNRPTDN